MIKVAVIKLTPASKYKKILSQGSPQQLAIFEAETE